MLNQVVLVGRLTKELEVKELEGNKKVCNITIAVPRSCKNFKGEYETDFINCTIWDNIAQNTAEYCHKGDVVGIKGRLQTLPSVDEDGNIKDYVLSIAVEKVTFLSSKSSNEKEKEEE
jgi:single-strand DNA-binding protein